MASGSSDLPPWLRASGARGAPARRRRGAGVARALAVIALLGAGFGGGLLVAGRRAPPPAPAVAAAPSCPAQPSCADPQAGGGGHKAPAPARAAARAKPVAAALRPLPGRKPLADGERTQALRAFAESRAPELRECLAEPDRGPLRKLGAAFEIDVKGTVESVQLLGADNSPRAVRRCYADRLKRWKFPEELLRGDEKLLVTFVL
jgi:hypothetical protein